METTWQENERGEIVIGSQAPMSSRALGAALPGLLVVLVLFLVFAVPAWMILAGRRWVTIDLPG